MCTCPMSCSAENLLAGGRNAVKKMQGKKRSRSVVVSSSMPVELAKRLQAAAESEGMTRSAYIADQLDDHGEEFERNVPLAALGRLIAIHQITRDGGLDRGLLDELAALVASLASSVRETFEQ